MIIELLLAYSLKTNLWVPGLENKSGNGARFSFYIIFVRRYVLALYNLLTTIDLFGLLLNMGTDFGTMVVVLYRRLLIDNTSILYYGLYLINDETIRPVCLLGA